MKLRHTDKNKTTPFFEGMHDGIPIGLGYLAVSFSLGIAAKKAGLSAFEAFLASFLCNASAGEYAGFTLIAANAAYIEMALVTLITNARYLLMSCAMSQRMRPEAKLGHRLAMSFYITDELFGIAVAREGYLDPFYTYGAVMTAAPFWCLGTAAGAIAGSILPARLTAALSVSLYGMFLAVIVPPARKNRVIAGIILVSFAASFAAAYLPAVSAIPSGTRTIILTAGIAAAAALLFPVKEGEDAHDGA